MVIKMFLYGIYMLLMRLKGLKYDFLKKYKGEDDANKYAFKLYKKWADFTIKIVGINIVVDGLENIPDETCVFMGNHTSILDVPILIKTITRDLGFISKKEVLKTPVIGYWLNKGKNVPLDRSNPREGIKAIGIGVDNLRSGVSMVIFPEGRRSKDGEIKEFKRGSMKLATKAGVPIVPVYIDRASRCFEDDRKFKSGTINIVFGKPIDTKDMSKNEEISLAERVYNEIRQNSELQLIKRKAHPFRRGMDSIARRNDNGSYL